MKQSLLAALIVSWLAALIIAESSANPLKPGTYTQWKADAGSIDLPPDDPLHPKPFAPGDCNDIPNHKIVVTESGSLACVPVTQCTRTQAFGNFATTNTDCRIFPITPKFYQDPNDKVGAPGAADGRFIVASAPLVYDVLFENEATATAPAPQVLVIDQLDPVQMDLATFALGPINFGDITVIVPPGLADYSAAVDLRPDQNIAVRIDAHLNRSSGLATWLFTSIDPDTQQIPEDPFAGFLPPNSMPPAGQGGVVFSVMPKQGLATGTRIQNQAKVIFGVNAPINTPVWSNTIDDTPPVTHVLALAATQPGADFPVQWSGMDVGSGILSYTVFVSDNAGAFTVWQQQTTATSATFSGQVGHSYGFYSIGQDLVGNIETAKNAAEATTSVGSTSSCASDVSAAIRITRSGYGYNFATRRFVQTVTLRNATGSAIAGPLSLALDNLSSNATLFNASGPTVCAAPLGSPFVNASAGLDAGASVSVILQFADPAKTPITYATRVLAGGAP
jgi:hypothetical protein